LPNKYTKDAPYRAKNIIGNTAITKKVDTHKAMINFNIIRNEMKKNTRSTSKQAINSKSPIHRDNSYKTKLRPIASTKPDKESITPCDISDLSCNRDKNNIVPVKQNPNDRKFSIIDILSESKLLIYVDKPNGDPTFKQITNKRDKALYLLVNSK
jgi:hypothetical protein